MTTLASLWLPIVLSSIFCFLLSFVIHTVLPWHKGDYGKMPREEDVTAALRPLAIPPGDYMVPRPSSMKELRTPEFLEKLRQGPVMVVTVMPNGPGSMGRSLVLWFLYLVVVGVFSGYIAGRALGPATPYLRVFRFVGASAFLAYAAALWQMSIWYRRSWLTTFKATVDGLLYALVTAGTFGWLWPH